MKLFEREQPSLFGEILDWMLTPLLLIWPVSLALTWLVAQELANKPFDRALARRGMGGASTTIKHGPLSYDQAGRVASIEGKMVELSARELGLLEVLLQRSGRLVSKDQLVERLCEWGEEVSNNAIEVYIHRLRKKIEQGPVRIATVRGLGYCLEPEPNSASRNCTIVV